MSIIRVQDEHEAIDTSSTVCARFSTICVVIDVRFADASGFDLVRILQTTKQCQDVRFVFLTGNPNPEMRARAMAFGADAILAKPCGGSDYRGYCAPANGTLPKRSALSANLHLPGPSLHQG